MSLLLTLFCIFSWAEVTPNQPTDAADPGSNIYPYEVFRQTFKVNGRTVDYFAPKGQTNLSLVVFGHGQAVNASYYRETAEHLAGKGVAVAFPKYDNSFFDHDWSRMAIDFVDLTFEILQRYAAEIDPQKVIFAGHSKGGYVALMAAGVPESQQIVEPAAVVLFAPAGFNQEYLNRLSDHLSLSIFFGEKDRTVSEPMVKEIYERAPILNKQFVKVKSYNSQPEVPADHMYVLNKSTLLGGPDGVTALHYFGTWKWLMGAAWDLAQPRKNTNPYLYGDLALEMGLPGFRHERELSTIVSFK